MLVGTGIVTLVFAVAVVGWRWFGAGESPLDRGDAGWSTIAFVDRTSGDVVYVDRDGEVVAEAAGQGRTGSVYAGDGVVAVANSRVLSVLPPAGDDDTDVVAIDLPAQAQVTTIRTTEGTFLATGVPTGGDVTLVDLDEGTTIDIGVAAEAGSPATPTMFVETLRYDETGSMFAIADAANFQTIVVRFDEPEPVFLADQPLAVGSSLIATSQTVGLQADVSLVGLDRSAKATVPADIPAGGVGVMSGERLTFVSASGGVYRVEPGDDEAERIGAVAVPAGATIEWVGPAADGRRIVVGGATFEAVIDLDARTLFSTTFPTALRPTPPEPRWTCLPVGGEDGWHSIVDLESGEQVIELTTVDDVLGISADGCTVLGDIDGTANLITADGVLGVGTYDRAVLAPDGRSVVGVRDDLIELVVVDDDMNADDPIDLTGVAASNALIAFVPD